jgi:8-oxo-dGTP pyrophosphatase MutT (NUDIX family)
MDDAPRRWITLASRRLLERWWMTLRVDRVQIPGGPVLDEFHVAEYPDWACTLALTDDGAAVLVEQYRYAIDRVAYELPAGVVDPGEDPAATARRELLEETGYEAQGWEPLGRLAVEPGRHTNWGHLFLARGARRVRPTQHDATEDIRVRLVPAATLPALIEAGGVVHGVHAAAVFWAAARGALPNPGTGPAFTGAHDPPPPMQKEQKTILVSVNVEDHDDQDARMNEIGQRVGQGWRVIQAIPVSGDEAGPGGASEDFMRYQVTVEREVDSDNVIVDADRGGAADLKDAGQVSAAFDGPINDDEEE